MAQIIVDPEFQTLGEKNSKWDLQAHHGVAITASAGNGVFRFEIEHTTGCDWHGQLLYAPFPVYEGDIYTVSFSARAMRPCIFSVWFTQHHSPYLSLVSDENHFGQRKITMDWQGFSHVWKPLMSEKTARLSFVLGQVDNVVEITNVELKNRTL